MGFKPEVLELIQRKEVATDARLICLEFISCFLFHQEFIDIIESNLVVDMRRSQFPYSKDTLLPRRTNTGKYKRTVVPTMLVWEREQEGQS